MTDAEIREIKKEAVLVLMAELLTRAIAAYDKYLASGRFEGIGLTSFPDLLLDELEDIETDGLLKRLASQIAQERKK